GFLLAEWLPPRGEDMEIRCPGVCQPPTRTADDAGLRDDAEVIGVCAGGHSRAYYVGAMARPERHVINDVLGDQPVTATFCDRTRCSRVFAGTPGEGPLDVGVAGWMSNSLALRVGGEDYSQKTGRCLSRVWGGRIPYEEHPHVRTTWKEWRQAHPDTDVYVGPLAAGPAPASPG